jgi:hypothetical protein
MSWESSEEVDELLHTSPSCIGEWEQEHRGRTMYWRCSVCRTVYYDAPGVMRAAITENAMGRKLNALARVGQQQRDRGEELPEGWDR